MYTGFCSGRCIWMTPHWTRRGALLLWPESIATLNTSSCRRLPATATGRVTRGAPAMVMMMSTRTRIIAEDTISPAHWKLLYRAFLLHVHPDFFHHLPDERAVNEKNLQALSMHLNSTVGGAYRSKDVANGGGSRLVFFLKASGSRTDTTIHSSPQKDCSSRTNGNDTLLSSSSLSSPPRKVMLSLQAQRSNTRLELRHLLHAAGVAPPEIPTPPPRQHHQHQQRQQRQQSESHSPSDAAPDWGADWADDLFGGTTAANRAWYDATTDQQRRRRGQDRRNSGTNNDNGGGSDARSSGEPWGLAHVLSTETGRNLVRERRRSARKVRRLVDALRERHGFGEFMFRCGWSKSNLCVALGALLDACATHQGAFHVPRFGGLEIVFRNDPSVLDKGEIRLSPADVPLVWVSVLQGITRAHLAEVEEQTRDVRTLEKDASIILRGASLSKGLSCSNSRYHEFLSGLCAAENSVGVDETAVELSSQGDWSELRCKVEEGFSRASTVLEDGTIQIGSDMTLETVCRCLGRDLARSSAISAESSRLAATATVAAARCRQNLGLEAIARGPGVSLAQMVTACEALVGERGGGAESSSSSGGLGGVGGGGAAEGAAALRRLRGHCVRIVGKRHGDVDGVTEDGEIAVRWDWAEEMGQRNNSGSSSSSPFW